MAQIGTVFTADDAKKQLRTFNKEYGGQQAWLNAYNAVDEFQKQGYQNIENLYAPQQTALATDFSKQQNLVLGDYSTAVADAYKSALEQIGQIGMSDLGQGYKNKLSTDMDVALDNAYKNYLQNYRNQVGDLSANYIGQAGDIYNAALTAQQDIDTYAQQQIANLNTELQTQITNAADYVDAHFNYLSKLYELYEEDPEKYAYIFESDMMAPYVDVGTVGGMQNIVTGLKDIDELYSSMFTDGKLNETGIDFITMMDNLALNEDGYSLDDYLTETNPKLLEWLTSENRYGSTFMDAAGNRTNRAWALGSAGLGADGIISGEYEYKGPTREERYSKGNAASYTVNTDVGNMHKFITNEGDNLVKLDLGNSSFEIKGNPRDKDDGNNFRLTSGGKTYYLEVVPSDKDETAKLTDAQIDDIVKSAGTIKNNEFYYYNDALYLSFVDDTGKVTMRKIQGQGGSGIGDTASTNKTYEELIKLFTKDNLKPRDSVDFKNFNNPTLNPSAYVKNNPYKK